MITIDPAGMSYYVVMLIVIKVSTLGIEFELLIEYPIV